MPWIALIFLSCLGLSLEAQALRLGLRADRDSFLLGDPCQLRCEWWVAQDAVLDRSSLDYASVLKTGAWEILDASPLEEHRQGEVWHLTQTFVITAWEEGWKVLPPLEARLRSGTVYRSDSLRLKVLFPKLAEEDTLVAQQAFVYEPKHWDDYWEDYGVYVLLLSSLGFLVFLIYAFWSYRPKAGPSVLSPKAWALEELRKIQAANYVERGQAKAYHTKLAWLAREYLHRCFPQAKARSASLQDLASPPIGAVLPHHLLAQLVEVLHTADLIKFAKASPLSPANTEALSVVTRLIHHEFSNK